MAWSRSRAMSGIGSETSASAHRLLWNEQPGDLSGLSRLVPQMFVADPNKRRGIHIAVPQDGIASIEEH